MRVEGHITNLDIRLHALASDGPMVGKIHFVMDSGPDAGAAGHCAIKLTPGADYDPRDMEVGGPTGYNGPWNAAGFRPFATKYYLATIEIPPDGGMPNITIPVGGQVQFGVEYPAPDKMIMIIQNSIIGREMPFWLEVPDPSAGSW